MAYQYTVKQGDKSLNSIVQGLGFSNYRAAGVEAVPSGNFDQIRPGDVITVGNYTQGQSPTLASTPAVISSKDMATGFSNNSDLLNTKIAPVKTQAEMNAEKAVEEADKTTESSVVKTGNALFDSLALDTERKDREAVKKAKEEKRSQMALLNTSLAAIDSTYQSTLGNIQNVYDASFAVQSRINNLNVARTKAYGLASGGALSTPLEFTNAISGKEQEAAAQIQKLDNARQQAISAAMAARDTGNARVMQASLDSVHRIEQDMRNNLADIAKQATDRFTLLNNIAKQQQADLKEQATKLLAEAVAKQSNEFGDATTPDEKDKIVKNIIEQSGGLLDYGAVYQGLNTAVAEGAKAASEEAYNRARINSANASAAVNWAKAARGGSEPSAEEKKGNVYGGINMLINDNDEDGQPYTVGDSDVPYRDPNGFLTPEGFKALSSDARAHGVSRSEFLNEYGNKLFSGDDNSYDGYGLTRAEKDKLLGL